MRSTREFTSITILPSLVMPFSLTIKVCVADWISLFKILNVAGWTGLEWKKRVKELGGHFIGVRSAKNIQVLSGTE